MAKKKKETMTTAFGHPVGNDLNSVTAGPRGLMAAEVRPWEAGILVAAPQTNAPRADTSKIDVA